MGERLHAAAARIVGDMDGLLQELRGLAAPAALRLAVTPALPLRHMGPIVAAWNRAFPGRIGQVPHEPSAALLEDVREGRLDFAVVGLPGAFVLDGARRQPGVP